MPLRYRAKRLECDQLLALLVAVGWTISQNGECSSRYLPHPFESGGKPRRTPDTSRVLRENVGFVYLAGVRPSSVAATSACVGRGGFSTTQAVRHCCARG